MIQYPGFDKIAFEIGPFGDFGALKVHWYGIMYLIAFSVGWVLARVLEDLKPDVVHAHDPMAVALAAMALQMNPGLTPRPLLVAARRVDFHLKSHAFSKWKYKKIDLFIAASEVIAGILVSDGIPRDRITVERDSRTTAENATLTKALVDPKPGERWLLVTSSYHMPRAVGVFRKAGFAIEPYPVDWLSDGKDTWFGFPHSIAHGLASIDYASHEWVGLLAYWLTGRTSELFPGPDPAG